MVVCIIFLINLKAASVKKKYIDFDDASYYNASIYQTSSVNNDFTFISGSTSSTNGLNNAFTLEADISAPQREVEDEGYYRTSFLSSSIYGFREAIDTDVTDYTWATSMTASLSVWLVRDKIESKDAHFVVKSADGTIHLVSDYIQNIYDNTHWNLALRIKPRTYPYAGNVTNATPSYDLNFYAVNHNMDIVRNEILLSEVIEHNSGSAFLSNAKRVYAGARLEILPEVFLKIQTSNWEQ